MKKAISLYYLSIVLICILAFISEMYEEEIITSPFDYARITDVDYKAVVIDEPNSNGKITITERLTFDIHAASTSNLFWELWRDLPESYIDGLKVDYNVNSVKQIYDDGTEVIFSESPKLYWNDSDYLSTNYLYGPGKWYHSKGPYNEYYRRYECVLFYVNGLYREQPVFEIEYEMNNAAFRYKDCSELYLCMYSEDTIKYLDSFKGQILVPLKDMPSEGNYYAHTYGTNSNEFPFTESETINPGYHTFTFELDKSDLKFKPYNQYIEFALVSYGADKHIFTEYAPNNDYSNDNVLSELQEEHAEYKNTIYNYTKLKIVVLSVCLIWSFLILKKLLKADNKIEEKYEFYKPEVDFKYFRDIPSNLDPVFASILAFCKTKPSKKNTKDGYSAIMLSLVRKNYIELAKIDEEKDWIFNNVKIIIKYRPSTSFFIHEKSETYPKEDLKELEPLTPSEKYYFDLINRHSKGFELPMKTFQSRISSDINNTDSFVRNIEKSSVDIGVSQGYFQKADYNEPKHQLNSKALLYGIIGILFITLVNFASYQTRLDFAYGGFTILGITYLFGAFIFKYLSKKYILLTQFGEDEYAKWNGLYNFLNSETLMRERTVVELPLWEQYLVYATAFGISDKVIKALQIRCPEVNSSQLLSNPYYRSSNFYSTNRSFRSAAHTASHIARSSGFSSGYGGHGGYGGGGRGGGGGRWRSLILYKNKLE